MPINIGTAALTKAYSGATPLKSIYVGAEKVWPPDLASPIPAVKGVPTAATGTTVALPAHTAGDLIVVFAQNHNTLTAAAPTIPAAVGTVAAWNTLYKNSNSEGVPIHVGWFLATGTGHTCGTWTGANGVSAVVVTNVNQTDPIGSAGGVKSISTGGSSPVIPALEEPGTSAILCYYAVAYSSGGFGAPPAGYTKHFSDARVCINSALDTNAYKPVPMPHTSGLSLTWRDVAFEVKAPGAEPPYLYGADVEYLPAYGVKFTLKKGIPATGDEAFALRCAYYPTVNGYVLREFTKTFRSTASPFDVVIEDLYGDGTGDPAMRKTITVSIFPKP